jgi:hypothetical protein
LTDWKSLGQKPLEDMKAQENPVEKDGQEEYFERRRKELVRVGGVETSLDDDIEQPVPTTKAAAARQQVPENRLLRRVRSHSVT